MSNSPEAANNVILFDPYPRPLDLIFAPRDKARLEQMGRVVWHDGDKRASDDFIDEHLPHAMAFGRAKRYAERAPRSCSTSARDFQRRKQLHAQRRLR
jgi:hypothetical protein